ncbi:MAG: hypothetical protein RL641_711 [Candidatus Parcubacteria bacterium]|jgi:predicted Zn-dependent peptidase
MNTINFTLSNGLRIISTRKNDSPIISITLAGIASGLSEAPNEIGMAHFLEHLVLKQTIKYPDEKIFSELIKSTGGYSNGTTGYNVVHYSASHNEDYIETAFDFISQLFLYPIFSQQVFDREKKVILEEAGRHYSNIDVLVYQAIVSSFSKNSRLQATVIGTKEQIACIELETLKQFHAKLYLPKYFLLSIVSNKSNEEIIALCEKYFESKVASNQITFDEKYITNIKYTEPSKKEIVLEFPHLKSDKLTFAFGLETVTLEENDAMAIGREIVRKRLYDILRVNLGLTYGVICQHSTNSNLGIFSISIESANENITKAETTIQNEISNIISNGINEQEFERAKSRYKVQLDFLSEKSLGIAEQIAVSSVKRNESNILENEYATLSKLSRQIVETTLHRYLRCEPLKVIATCGEKK